MHGENPCRYLEWDSEFFGRRIASARVSRLTADTVEEILAWSRTNRIECLYFLADSDHSETVRLAEDHGFRQVDIRMTLACDVSHAVRKRTAPRSGRRGRRTSQRSGRSPG